MKYPTPLNFDPWTCMVTPEIQAHTHDYGAYSLAYIYGWKKLSCCKWYYYNTVIGNLIISENLYHQ